MDFRNIPITAQPAYTWLWNTHITREGIKTQIDEMYDSGIRAFYVIGEPENFRPLRRRTHLFPEYLSEEYIDLLFYAFSYAKEKGMYTWLYNEGGFPSGMVCGKIRKEHPKLAKKKITSLSITLAPNEPYIPGAQALAAFLNKRRIKEGDSFSTEASITEYRWQDDLSNDVQSDNASPLNTKLFIELTHEKLKKRFGAHMGTDITLMFDDEACMGTWTEGLDRLFYNRYGYDITDFLPYITGDIEPTTEEQYRANSDFFMLCGDLVRENYFIPMRDWLRAKGMRSTGHLDKDHQSDNCCTKHYGNTMHTLRSFDVPGIDVILGQIGYRSNEKIRPEGISFFPRLASSAARQLGHSKCVSESLAVYGAHVTPEMMRFIVNYQAVRGISLFNFMVISYDRETAMPLQYRPNFIKENPSMDRLAQINDYTARLSYLLQESCAIIETALYYPARSICAGGALGEKAQRSYERLGHLLEEQGVSFDIIDEDLVTQSSVINGCLTSEHVSYRNVILPEGDLEPKAVLDKLIELSNEATPCIERKNSCIQARHLAFSDGREGYFICNLGEKTVDEEIGIKSERQVCKIDLFDGSLHTVKHTRMAGMLRIPLRLLRGEGIFLLLSDLEQEETKQLKTERICSLTDFNSYINRIYTIDREAGMKNTYHTTGSLQSGLYEWDNAFSGEVTYSCSLANFEDGDYILDLGNVRHTAVAYINDRKVGEATMPPYRIPFRFGGNGELRIVVANTAANACANTDYFEKSNAADVGPYHAKMVPNEEQEIGGGLLGPVTIEKVLQ